MCITFLTPVTCMCIRSPEAGSAERACAGLELARCQASPAGGRARTEARTHYSPEDGTHTQHQVTFKV